MELKKLNRRNFLDGSVKATTGAAVAAGIASATASAAPSIMKSGVSANDQINVALIGAGGMGMADLRDFLRVPEVNCLAIADVDDSRTQAGIQEVEKSRGKKPDGYRDFRKIIDRKDIDAVIIGTPDHWHALPTIHACETGKDVYVEKPLALTIEEGRVMVNAARKYNRVVQVGTQQRSAGHFQDAVNYVQSGKLGNIRQVRTWAYIDWKGGLGNIPDGPAPDGVDYDMWLGPAPKRPFNPARFHFTFRWFWNYSGGLMTDWGAHMVDVAMWAMNEEPIGAMAMGGKYGYPDDMMETPDTQQSIIEFPSFSCTWEHMIGCGIGPWQREHGAEFHGQNGILVVDRGGWEVFSETDADGKPKEYRMTPVPHRGASRDYHFAHVRNFIDCMKTREKPRSDVEIGHKSVIACHLGNIAAKLRSQIRFDPKKEEITGNPEAQKLAKADYRTPWRLPKI